MSDANRPLAPPSFPRELAAIVEQEPYPRFSAGEMTRRRRESVAAAMVAASVDHLVVYGANRVGNAVPWLTHWPTTTEAVAVVSPGERDALYVQYYNHLPLARRIAGEARVEWGDQSGIGCAIAELERRHAKPDRVGVIGHLGFRGHAQLAAAFGRIADLNPAYVRLRLVKSAEEIRWLKVGAAFSDLGITALAEKAHAGLSERELGAIVEGAYLPYGATNQIHFFGATPMAEPRLSVPAQFPATRRLAQGDVLFTEISAYFWEYSGQVLRTFAVAADPPPLYQALHATAERAFDAITAELRAGATPAQLVFASGLIEDAGFTTCDDLVHGYGGGYFPPILGSKSRPAGPIPDLTLEAGMCVVVQPNVITKDARAGVQVGELVHITATGCERLHNTPRGFLRIGG